MSRDLVLRLRCDQNRLFGCGKVSQVPASLLVIGHDRQRVMAYAPCKHCGLPLAEYRDVTPSERVHCRQPVGGVS